jgi:hypothetical protein
MTEHDKYAADCTGHAAGCDCITCVGIRIEAQRAARGPRIKGCTCASGIAGGSCTLDCRAPAWRR